MAMTDADKARVAKAIKHFEALQKRYTRQHNGTACEHVGLALEGLRRMAEQPEVVRCEYCDTPGKFLAVIDAADPRILISVSGSYLQVFDEEYPGFVDNTKIHNCPMCGRALDGQRAGEVHHG